MKIAVVGGGAGGAAAVAELVSAGHEVRLWSRSQETLAPFQAQGGVAFDGIMGAGLAKPGLMTCDLAGATDGADLVLICVPTPAHKDVADALARNRSKVPIVLNPGHTGGALEVRQTFIANACDPPPIAAFSTLTYVARKYTPARVTISGKAKSVRLAAMPGGEQAAELAKLLFASARPVPDVLACDLANVNMVLHIPGAVLGAAWVEATGGDFTFYVQGMTGGVARVMRALDDERRAVGRAFNHQLPALTAEMQAIGTVEESTPDIDDFVAAISSGEANRRADGHSGLRPRGSAETCWSATQWRLRHARLTGRACASECSAATGASRKSPVVRRRPAPMSGRMAFRGRKAALRASRICAIRPPCLIMRNSRCFRSRA